MQAVVRGRQQVGADHFANELFSKMYLFIEAVLKRSDMVKAYNEFREMAVNFGEKSNNISVLSVNWKAEDLMEKVATADLEKINERIIKEKILRVITVVSSFTAERITKELEEDLNRYRDVANRQDAIRLNYNYCLTALNLIKALSEGTNTDETFAAFRDASYELQEITVEVLVIRQIMTTLKEVAPLAGQTQEVDARLLVERVRVHFKDPFSLHSSDIERLSDEITEVKQTGFWEGDQKWMDVAEAGFGVLKLVHHTQKVDIQEAMNQWNEAKQKVPGPFIDAMDELVQKAVNTVSKDNAMLTEVELNNMDIPQDQKLEVHYQIKGRSGEDSITTVVGRFEAHDKVNRTFRVEPEDNEKDKPTFFIFANNIDDNQILGIELLKDKKEGLQDETEVLPYQHSLNIMRIFENKSEEIHSFLQKASINLKKREILSWEDELYLYTVEFGEWRYSADRSVKILFIIERKDGKEFSEKEKEIIAKFSICLVNLNQGEAILPVGFGYVENTVGTYLRNIPASLFAWHGGDIVTTEGYLGWRPEKKESYPFKIEVFLDASEEIQEEITTYGFRNVLLRKGLTIKDALKGKDAVAALENMAEGKYVYRDDGTVWKPEAAKVILAEDSRTLSLYMLEDNNAIFGQDNAMMTDQQKPQTDEAMLTESVDQVVEAWAKGVRLTLIDVNITPNNIKHWLNFEEVFRWLREGTFGNKSYDFPHMVETKVLSQTRNPFLADSMYFLANEMMRAIQNGADAKVIRDEVIDSLTKGYETKIRDMDIPPDELKLNSEERKIREWLIEQTHGDPDVPVQIDLHALRRFGYGYNAYNDFLGILRKTFGMNFFPIDSMASIYYAGFQDPLHGQGVDSSVQQGVTLKNGAVVSRRNLERVMISLRNLRVSDNETLKIAEFMRLVGQKVEKGQAPSLREMFQDLLKKEDEEGLSPEYAMQRERIARICAFFDLVQHARNWTYPIDGSSKKILMQHGLLDRDWNVPESVCHIVSASVQGEELEVLGLVSPVEENDAQTTLQKEETPGRFSMGQDNALLTGKGSQAQQGIKFDPNKLILDEDSGVQDMATFIALEDNAGFAPFAFADSSPDNAMLSIDNETREKLAKENGFSDLNQLPQLLNNQDVLIRIPFIEQPVGVHIDSGIIFPFQIPGNYAPLIITKDGQMVFVGHQDPADQSSPLGQRLLDVTDEGLRNQILGYLSRAVNVFPELIEVAESIYAVWKQKYNMPPVGIFTDVHAAWNKIGETFKKILVQAEAAQSEQTQNSKIKMVVQTAEEFRVGKEGALLGEILLNDLPQDIEALQNLLVNDLGGKLQRYLANTSFDPASNFEVSSSSLGDDEIIIKLIVIRSTETLQEEVHFGRPVSNHAEARLAAEIIEGAQYYLQGDETAQDFLNLIESETINWTEKTITVQHTPNRGSLLPIKKLILSADRPVTFITRSDWGFEAPTKEGYEVSLVDKDTVEIFMPERSFQIRRNALKTDDKGLTQYAYEVTPSGDPRPGDPSFGNPKHGATNVDRIEWKVYQMKIILLTAEKAKGDNIAALIPDYENYLKGEDDVRKIGEIVNELVRCGVAKTKKEAVVRVVSARMDAKYSSEQGQGFIFNAYLAEKISLAKAIEKLGSFYGDEKDSKTLLKEADTLLKEAMLIETAESEEDNAMLTTRGKGIVETLLEKARENIPFFTKTESEAIVQESEILFQEVAQSSSAQKLKTSYSDDLDPDEVKQIQKIINLLEGEFPGQMSTLIDSLGEQPIHFIKSRKMQVSVGSLEDDIEITPLAIEFPEAKKDALGIIVQKPLAEAVERYVSIDPELTKPENVIQLLTILIHELLGLQPQISTSVQEGRLNEMMSSSKTIKKVAIDVTINAIEQLLTNEPLKLQTPNIMRALAKQKNMWNKRLLKKRGPIIIDFSRIAGQPDEIDPSSDKAMLTDKKTENILEESQRLFDQLEPISSREILPAIYPSASWFRAGWKDKEKQHIRNVIDWISSKFPEEMSALINGLKEEPIVLLPVPSRFRKAYLSLGGEERSSIEFPKKMDTISLIIQSVNEKTEKRYLLIDKTLVKSKNVVSLMVTLIHELLVHC